jgi:hypothetical protein
MFIILRQRGLRRKVFNVKHLKKIEEITETQLRRSLQERIKKLRTDYQDNPYISEAEVSQESEDIKITLHLNFSPEESENQNLPLVFEYGGVIMKKDENGNLEMVEIEPGFYIKRNLIDG